MSMRRYGCLGPGTIVEHKKTRQLLGEFDQVSKHLSKMGGPRRAGYPGLLHMLNGCYRKV